MVLETVKGATTIPTQTSQVTKKVQPLSTANLKSESETKEVGNKVETTVDPALKAKESENGQDAANNQKNSQETVKRAVEQLNKNMSHSEAIFGIHEETNRVTIKIVDTDTNEVIKEIPPEKTLDMIAKIWEMAGILVDEKR